jgi:hypothetical protein
MTWNNWNWNYGLGHVANSNVSQRGESGDLSTVCSLYDMGGIDVCFGHFKLQSTEPFLHTACGKGHLDVAIYLHSVGAGKLLSEVVTCDNYTMTVTNFIPETTFPITCEEGHFDVAVWLHATIPINLPEVQGEAFECGCRSGNKALAEWVYGLRPMAPHEFLRKAKNLEVAQWVHGLHYLWTAAQYFGALENACRAGDPRFVEWVVEVAPPESCVKISNTAYQAHFLCAACMSGNVQLAE